MNTSDLNTIIYLRLKDEDLSELTDLELVEKYLQASNSLKQAYNQLKYPDGERLKSINKRELGL